MREHERLWKRVAEKSANHTAKSISNAGNSYRKLLQLLLLLLLLMAVVVVLLLVTVYKYIVSLWFGSVCAIEFRMNDVNNTCYELMTTTSYGSIVCTYILIFNYSSSHVFRITWSVSVSVRVRVRVCVLNYPDRLLCFIFELLKFVVCCSGNYFITEWDKSRHPQK